MADRDTPAPPSPPQYPRQCERHARTRDGAEFFIRPIRPDDMQREMAFLREMSERTRYNRLMYSVNEPTEARLRPLLNIDYRQKMALAALHGVDGAEKIIGVARYSADESGTEYEFAAVVTDAWQNRGVGKELLTDLFEYARRLGLKRLYGTVLAGNEGMLRLSRAFGLQIQTSREDTSLITVFKTFDV